MKRFGAAALLILWLGARASATEGYVAGADGVRLFYRIAGAGSPSAVLLHGGPGSNMNGVWPDLEPLARTRTILMYDQRGGGRSEIFKDPSRLQVEQPELFFQAVERFLRRGRD